MKYYCSCFDDGSEPGFDATVEANVSLYIKLDENGQFKYVNDLSDVSMSTEQIKRIIGQVTCGCCGSPAELPKADV